MMPRVESGTSVCKAKTFPTGLSLQPGADRVSSAEVSCQCGEGAFLHVSLTESPSSVVSVLIASKRYQPFWIGATVMAYLILIISGCNHIVRYRKLALLYMNLRSRKKIQYLIGSSGLCVCVCVCVCSHVHCVCLCVSLGNCVFQGLYFIFIVNMWYKVFIIILTTHEFSEDSVFMLLLSLLMLIIFISALFTLPVKQVLLAIGRDSCTRKIGLEKIGVKMNEK